MDWQIFTDVPKDARTDTEAIKILQSARQYLVVCMTYVYRRLDFFNQALALFYVGRVG